MKTFRNDKERIAFLEDYRNTENGWILWKQDEDLERRMWRYNLPDGAALIVEEQELTCNYLTVHSRWFVIHWYIVESGEDYYSKHFGDWVASKTLALNKLKELGRKK